MKIKLTLLSLMLLFICSFLSAQKIKVACIGNSVTYGVAIENREKNCYPAQLQNLLGSRYDVHNFGKSGATLLYKGHRPYVLQDEFKSAKTFAADYVIIHLGLNDTDPRNWPDYGDEFIRDYLSLIDSFRVANPECKIRICKMTPIFNSHPRFKSGTRDWFWQIQSSIEKIAGIAPVELIDLHEPLYSRPDLFPDAIHPNAEGAAIIAKTVYSALTGNYGGLQLSPLFSDNGVIGYQGESNAHNIEAHEQLFSLLVKSWRENRENDFPFYYVQLSGMNRPSWPAFRDSQRRLSEKIPHTGMAVSFDYGDSTDVHPKHKKPVGQRLARLALNQTYQKRHVVPTGPLFQSVSFDNGKATVSFMYANKLQTSDGKPLREFEAAEIDGLYYPAEAKIVNNKVVVESNQVRNIHFVRYAWKPFSHGNLVNEEGLPASTFSSK